jgi:hypothetical protein
VNGMNEVTHGRLAWICALTIGAVLAGSCGKGAAPRQGSAGAKKHVLTLAIQEDHKLFTRYSGTGRYNSTTWRQSTQDGSIEVRFDGMHPPPGDPPPGVWHTQVMTQYNDARVTAVLRPADTNWVYLVCSMQVDCQVPIDLLFAGILSTNTANTNGDDTLFSFPPCKTNLRFVGKLSSVIDISSVVEKPKYGRLPKPTVEKKKL